MAPQHCALHVFLVIFCIKVSSLAGHAWLHTGPQLQLGLLPFAIEDALQIGETREVHMFEERFSSCLNNAVTTHGGYLGGILFNDAGQAAHISPLMQIEKWQADDVGVWARLRCIGRTRLRSISTSEREYTVANVELYNDDVGSIPQASLDDIRVVHARVAAQRRQLLNTLAISNMGNGTVLEDARIHISPIHRQRPFGLFVDDEAEGEDELVYVGEHWERPGTAGTCFFHCRDPGELDDEESGQDLHELLDARRRTLTQPLDSHAVRSPLVEAVGELWEVAGQEQAELQLLSFAATAVLSPLERFEALLIRDTCHRFSLALESLRDQERRLTEIQLALEAGIQEW